MLASVIKQAKQIIADLIYKVRKAIKWDRFDIPLDIYRQVREWSVIATVDFVVVRRIAGEFQFMLPVRKGSSLNNKRFIFGGRQPIGWTLEETLRELKQREAGLNEQDELGCRQSHSQDIFIEACPSPKGDLPASHMRMCIYVVEVVPGFIPTGDGSWENAQWFTEATLPDDIIPDVKLILAGARLIGVQPDSLGIKQRDTLDIGK